VTEAEKRAANNATAVSGVLSLLRMVDAFGLLSDNSEEAIRLFLDRYPELRRRVVAVYGRESLNGPKREWPVFRRAVEECWEVLTEASPRSERVYVGDQKYELDLAIRWGARGVLVREGVPFDYPC
jgi:hypothetical protein